MNNRKYEWDRQFGELLTRSYGEVKEDEKFRSALLAKLKRKTEENRMAVMQESKIQIDIDANWSRLLTHAYVPCEPRPHFKEMLLSELQNKQAVIQTEIHAEAGLKAILSSYEPVTARREFKTHLLDSLKNRQRHTDRMRKKSLHRTIFMSAISSMAAAAVVFIVWIQPVIATPESQVTPAPTTSPGSMASSRSIPDSTFRNILASSEKVAPLATAGSALSFAGSYSVSDVFQTPTLPSTMRGIGMEINYGDGWQAMDETLIANVMPGIALRPRPDTQTPGLGFGDGSTIHMRPDSVIEATDKGFVVRQGTMTVNVPNNSDSRFYLHFAERDVAMEPGTMLAVTVEPEDRYAIGGAPAPVIKVLDGGMAVTRSKAGNGVLLANQVYSLDRYITPDLPGRPLCATEFAELEKALLMQPVPPAQLGYSAKQLVAGNESIKAYETSRGGYSKHGNQWVANSYDDDIPTIRVQYLSDDYFGFVNGRRDLATVLALGPEVIIDGRDGNFYEIYQ